MSEVLDKGFVDLVDYMASDLSVVASARVSNGITRDQASKGDASDAKLIGFLMRNRHGTPFEHNAFTFLVKCPIFVAREWQRHRIGSFNEISGRYTEFQPEFYVPSAARGPGATNKQGSEFLNNEAADKWLSTQIDQWTKKAYIKYQELLQFGIAKEMARMVLPLNLYTEFYWTVNARSLLNFLSLRTADVAMWEIRQYANAIEMLFCDVMPFTYDAWTKSGRIAP